MCSGKTKYIINDIYDIIVSQIVYTKHDVVHHVLCSIAMQLLMMNLNATNCVANVDARFSNTSALLLLFC